MALLSLPLIVITALGASRAGGDSLRARVYQDSYLLFEPLVVEVTLHLDEPFMPGMEDPYKALEQLRRLHRRLYVELRDNEGEKASKTLLCGAEFLPSEDRRSEFRTTGLAFPQTPDRGGDFVPWEGTGSFLLVVRDYEHRLESNAMPVSIRSPAGSEGQAAQIFRKGSPEVAKALLQSDGGNSARGVLERLAHEYSDTLYGKYAFASLALIRWNNTRREHNDKGGQEIWGPVAEELAKAATAFEAPHPVRARVLFELARAQGLAGHRSEARRTAETLSSEFPDTEFGRKAKAMVTKLPD
jgi:hypothetical protein